MFQNFPRGVPTVKNRPQTRGFISTTPRYIEMARKAIRREVTHNW